MRGSRDARFAALYESHVLAVSKFMARRLPTDECADAVAEVFTVLWRRIDEAPAEALPWLYTVGRNVVANHVRSTGRLSRLRQKLAAQPVELSAEPADPCLDGVSAAFARLREADQEALRLTAWEELSITDAARVLGCSEGAFRTRLHRARGRLRVYLMAAESDLSATYSDKDAAEQDPHHARTQR